MISFKSKLKQEDQVEFAKNLSMLLHGGVSIDEAIRSLADQARSYNLKRSLLEISGRLSKGVSLYSAMCESPGEFSTVVRSLVRAGELSGSLSENLNFLAEWLNRDRTLRKEINAVTLYPKLVISATIILGIGLIAFVLPRLVPMFQGLHVQLPAITQFILSMSVFMQHNWFTMLSAILLIVAIFIIARLIKPIKYIMDRSYIHIPYVGDMIRDYQLALFSQLMATLLKSGLTLDEALEIACTGTNNLYYFKALTDMRSRLINGVFMTETINMYPDLYPPNFVNLVAVGEKSGSLEESFFNLAEFYTREINTKTKTLPVIIEPVLLVIIGVAVATLALSIVLPIYKLTGSIT
jgi:type IV pilus assembly protein PilC